jgi:hypothetical protein
MKTRLTLLLLASVAIFFAGCSKYPPTSDRLTEDLAIITQYDTKANFNNYTTFAVSQTVKKITSTDTTTITGSMVTALLSEISVNMKKRGYADPTGEDKPDLGITVTYYQNTNVYAYYPDNYWGYPYYGWGWYYPYYPTYYGSYTTGLASIQLVDLKYPAPNNQLYIRWNAFIRGLLTNSHTTQDVTNAVDQAFIQTPQLVKTAK